MGPFLHPWVCELRLILTSPPVLPYRNTGCWPGSSDLSVRIRLIPMSPTPLLPGAVEVAALLTLHTPKRLSLLSLKFEARGVTHLTEGHGEFSLLCWDLVPQLGQELHEGRDRTFSPNSGLIIGALAHSKDPPQGPGRGWPFVTPLLPPHPRLSVCCHIRQ